MTDREDAVRRAHARLARAMAEDRDGEDPSDPSTVQAMPLVMEFPHDPLPDRRALLEAAATACVAVCLDPRAGQPEEDADEGSRAFAAALAHWYGARIRKIARRARNKKWRDVQSLPGVTVSVTAHLPGRDSTDSRNNTDSAGDGAGQDAVASVRAFTPCPVSETPGPVNKLQIQGADLVADPSYADTPEAVLDDDDAPVVYVDASLGMTVGKAAAQVGHGSMLLAAAMDPDTAVAWASRGFPLHVCEVSAERFAEVRATAEQRGGTRPGAGASDRAADVPAAAVVQDAGYTEVAPGSVTVVALARG